MKILHMKFAWLFGLMFIISSCIKNNPSPSWIKIEAWSLQANPDLGGKEGVLSHNLTDAWVYVGEKLIGAFELPIKIPVLIEGNQQISVYPAIRNNGISATKKIYPFCNPHIITATLNKNETVTINPVTSYVSNCAFVYKEDFELGSISLTTSPNSTASIVRTAHTDPDKTGYCGHIALNSTNVNWTGYTHSQMQLPIGGREVFLEIDYKTSNNLLTGVLGISSSSTKVNPNIQLNAQDPSTMVWKKIYIDLKEIVSSSTTAEYFEQYLEATLDAGKTSSDIYIDNIKVIRFQ